MFDPDATDEATACYHEAGHAWMAHLLGGHVTLCTIEDEDGSCMGKTTITWRGIGGRELARKIALAALAGPVAEARWRGDMDLLESLAAWEADWREATRAIAAFAAPHERSSAMRALIDEAASAFDDEDCWEQLCRVADALEAHGTLDRDLFGDAIGEE
jgi:hypothetical protein